MALPTGTIKMSDVLNELGKTSGSTITLNDSDVRSLAGKTSGTISMNDLKGKSDGNFELTLGYDDSTGGFELIGFVGTVLGNLNPKILENGARIINLGFLLVEIRLDTSIINNYPSSYTIVFQGKEYLFSYYKTIENQLLYKLPEEQKEIFYNMLKTNINKTIKITIK